MSEADTDGDEELSITTHLRGKEAGAFKKYREEMEPDGSRASAGRTLIRSGLSHAGYNGARIKTKTTLMSVAYTLTVALASLGSGYFAVGASLDIDLMRNFGMVALVGAAFMIGVYATLERHEPQVSQWLSSQFDARDDVRPEVEGREE